AESQCIKLIIGRLVKRDWLLIPSDSALEGMTTSNMSPMKTWYVVAMVLAPRPFVHKGRIGLVPSLGHATPPRQFDPPAFGARKGAWTQASCLLACAWFSDPDQSQKDKRAEPQSPQASTTIRGCEVAQFRSLLRRHRAGFDPTGVQCL